ncbi:SDR family NAD(P)-dependent oxidoreductase [Halobacillus halophilus]|uniref:SDR family NAD(P)-dependent oxidoreductase n=1 Tax=Halobacillus halophilus TaxID=1570 RepID=UPI001CD6DB36|nr:SDR family oxidoreductase [Halobacillus halophilus]MCA1010149.1 SDR family oxidoreductase [Halobacillus halophilus]
MPDLTNQITLITGANRGQGKAMAEHLAELGSRVVVAARDYSQAMETAEEIGNERAFPVKLDVTSEEEWKEAVSLIITRFGRIDTLINNAGILTRKPFSELTIEEYQKLIHVNQLGVFIGMQTVTPYMESRKKGAIINNLSISSFAPISGSSAYAATKAAVVAMSKSAAIELGPRGIRVNMIHPGGIETQMATQGKGVPESYQNIPLGRIGQPIEIARVAAFLASDESSYCTGTEIVVDGGMTLGTS